MLVSDFSDVHSHGNKLLEYMLQVNEEYVKVLQVLSKKLNYVAENGVSKDSLAMQDVIPEFEKLRAKAVYKVLTVLIIGVLGMQGLREILGVMPRALPVLQSFLITSGRDCTECRMINFGKLQQIIWLQSFIISYHPLPILPICRHENF